MTSEVIKCPIYEMKRDQKDIPFYKKMISETFLLHICFHN